MGFFKKMDYEKHANNLNKKLTKIVKTLDAVELREVCDKVIGKYPKEGTRIFDSQYTLIHRFGLQKSKDDYMLYFSHTRKQGKFSDLKLAQFLVIKDILDENDTDFNYLKQFSRSEDILDYVTPRNNFPQKIKDAIREIQRGRCAYRGCKNTEFFEYDHIRGRDDNSLSNCQMLCMYHHRLKTNEDAIKKRIEKDLDDGKSLSEINIGSKDPVRERPRIPRRKFPTKSSYHRKNSSRKPDSRKRRR